MARMRLTYKNVLDEFAAKEQVSPLDDCGPCFHDPRFCFWQQRARVGCSWRRWSRRSRTRAY